MFLTINDIREISSKMSEVIGVDYTGYSINFFRRRVTALFDKFGIHKIQDFYALLSDKKKVDEIIYEMTVPATELFRDPAFWRSLRKNLVGKTSLSVWLPNLTNGFELYSLLVLLKQIGIENVKVVGNLLSDMIEAEIRTLNIPQKYDEVNRANFERLESGMKYDDFFRTDSDGIVRPIGNLLSKVVFVKKWFMNCSIEKYDLIIFRNILLEYGPILQEKAVDRLVQSLNQGGMLATGIKENPTSRTTALKPVEKDESIYRL